MDPKLTTYIQTKKIDSFQKLYFLLLLYEYPSLNGTPQEFAQRFYLDALHVEKIINDLQSVDLLEHSGDSYRLCPEPTVQSSLENLAQAFANPLDRQEMLNCVKRSSPLSIEGSQI